jgi:hypothetical protein
MGKVVLVKIDPKDAEHTAQKSKSTWLSRYPNPSFCLHDNGGEFLGQVFPLMLQCNNIKNTTTTTLKKPKS